MPTRTHLLGAVMLFALLPFAAYAQTAGQSTTRPDDRAMVTEPGKLMGLAVFSSDGNKLGTVQALETGPDGKVKAIHIKSGSFLGIGGKMVAIPEGKFIRLGDQVRLHLTAEEVSKLPDLKEQS